jgi:hypothetical protein
MNVCPPFEADTQPAKLMKPTHGPLYYPPRYTQLAQHRQDVSAPQLLTQNSQRNGIHQFESLSHTVVVSASQPCGQRDPLSVGYDMMLATSFCPVGRVGVRLVPPKTARTVALSNTPRLQSMPSIACRPSRQARWMHPQTPCSCQSRSRRQQVMPLPQFI